MDFTQDRRDDLVGIVVMDYHVRQACSDRSQCFRVTWKPFNEVELSEHDAGCCLGLNGLKRGSFEFLAILGLPGAASGEAVDVVSLEGPAGSAQVRFQVGLEVGQLPDTPLPGSVGFLLTVSGAHRVHLQPVD